MLPHEGHISYWNESRSWMYFTLKSRWLLILKVSLSSWSLPPLHPTSFSACSVGDSGWSRRQGGILQSWGPLTGIWEGWQSHERFWKLMFMFSEETQPGKGQNQEVNPRHLVKADTNSGVVLGQREGLNWLPGMSICIWEWGFRNLEMGQADCAQISLLQLISLFFFSEINCSIFQAVCACLCVCVCA